MPPKFFIGIDISKLTLDIALVQDREVLRSYKIENTEKAMLAFLKEVKANYKCTRFNSFVCAENMGIYARFLSNVMIKKNFSICLEGPLQIKRSLGIVKGKNDKIDAVRIAQYATKNYSSLRILVPPRDAVEKLKKLTAIRKRLLKIKLMLSTPDKLAFHYYSAAEKRESNELIAPAKAAILSNIEKVNNTIDDIFKHDDKLLRLRKLICSVPGVGDVIATAVIIYTNEFTGITSPRSFANYCGVAPFGYASGTSLKAKPKVSHIANKDMKSLLHLAAVSSMRNKNSFIGKYYQRKTKEGKAPMLVLNAIRNKIIHRIFACVRDEQCYKEP